MLWHKKKKSHFLRKMFIVFGISFLFLIAARIMLPGIVTGVANRELARQSPHFSFHIKDIDLHLFQGKYLVKGITGKLKSNGEQFLKIKSILTDISRKNLFKGPTNADVSMSKMYLVASQELLNQARAEAERVKKIIAEEKAKKEREGKVDDPNKRPPVEVRSFALKDSEVLIKEFMSIKGEDIRRITGINLNLSNLTPSKDNPNTNFKLTANVFGDAPLVSVGSANLLDKAISWDMNTELKDFDLSSLNPFIKEKVSAFVHKGKMDVFLEAESSDNVIKGYVKPFVRKLRMDTPPGGFEFKGAAAATGGNLVKVLLTDSEAKTLATRVPFSFEKKLEFEVLPALQKAVVHRAQQNIPAGLEDKVGEKGLGMEEIEAQEADEEEKK